MAILLAALGIFFYVSYQSFSEDKKLFLMDLNMSVVHAAKSEVESALKNRLEEIQILAPRIYSPELFRDRGQDYNPFLGLSETLSEDLISLTFYSLKKEDNSYVPTKHYTNDALLKKREIPEDLVSEISRVHPLSLAPSQNEGNFSLHNRSLSLKTAERVTDLPILTVVLPGKFVGDETADLLIVADLFQDFLRKKLQQSEMAELFLISSAGNLLSHPKIETLIPASYEPLNHPILAKLKQTLLPRESFELNLQGEDYLVNVGQAVLPDLFLVSQIKKSDAFIALHQLFQKTTYLALLILCLAIATSILFATTLTKNIQKLRAASESIGNGELNIDLQIKSGDEIEGVSKSFEWMAHRISDLMKDTATKARMENELQTAKLVQSTVLQTPKIESEAFSIASYLNSASECGGDYWDAAVHGKTLTLIIGDATGHGAAAALITAIAKSCLTTLNSVYYHDPLTPEQFLGMLNKIIYHTAKGKLLMTMCIAQLDGETGELRVCNAGHESPFCLRSGTNEKAEVLFTRGERLGFSPESKYVSTTFKLNPKDTVLLYTDGISEAHNEEGKIWGERALKKSFSRAGTKEVTAIVADIEKDLLAHTQGAPQSDDVTFVLCQWTKPLAAKAELFDNTKAVAAGDRG